MINTFLFIVGGFIIGATARSWNQLIVLCIGIALVIAGVII